MTKKLSELFDRAFASYDQGEFEAVASLVKELREAGADEDDARLRFFELTVVTGDEGEIDSDDPESLLEAVRELLTDAVEIEEPWHATFVTLDLATMLASAGEVDEAEHAMRALLDRSDLDQDSADDVYLDWASLVFEDQEDPGEALAILDEASASLRERSTYASLRAEIYMDLERGDEAVAVLEQALERDDETELRYQLGGIYHELDRPEDAVAELLEVRRRDLAANDVDPEAAIDPDEAEDLRRHLEELLESLPDLVLKKLATASIRVERWPSEDAVRGGCNPRTALAFEGEPDTDDAEGHVDALVIYRDVLITSIDFDDDIVDLFAICLTEELDRYFDLELIPGM